MYFLQFIVFGLYGLLQLRLSGDFLAQLPTLFWEDVRVVVVSHEIHDRPVSSEARPMGKVSFKIVGDNLSKTYSDEVSERFDFGDVTAKMAKYIAGYAEGTEHLAYRAPDHSRLSLGHFPRWHGFSFFICGSVSIISAALWFLQWWRIQHKQATSVGAS